MLEIALPLACLALLVTGAASPGCRPDATDPSRTERAILERQVQGLEKLVAAGRAGRVIPFEQGLIVIDQALIRSLLDATFPYETRAGDFRIRIQRATVLCDDGVALVQLHGRASFANQPEDAGSVEATLTGALREFALDRPHSVLRGRFEVIAFEARRVRVLGQDDEAMKGLVHDLARLRLEAFRSADYEFDLPVRLLDDIVLPAYESRTDITIPAARLPLRVSVVDVNALDRKLWISVRMQQADSTATTGAVVPGAAEPGTP